MLNSSSATPVISLRNVSRQYGDVPAVAQANFEILSGKTTCLLGPSGSGKSTILRMIAGLEDVDQGEIHIAGQIMSSPKATTPPERRGVGLVFQDNALFPHLDVKANIGFGLRDQPKSHRAARVSTLLEQFHIQHLAASWPHMLSGGEQQRVAIARALAREPALLLLDEPFSGLDGVLRESIRETVLQDLRQAGATVLIVTHDPSEALSISDDLILMAGGKILQTGAPSHCYRLPQSVTAARLLGDYLSFAGEVRGGRLTTILGDHDAAGYADGPAQLGLRPEAITLGTTGTIGTAAQIIAVKFGGPLYRLLMSAGGTVFTVETNRSDLAVGQTAHLSYDRDAAQIYQ